MRLTFKHYENTSVTQKIRRKKFGLTELLQNVRNPEGIIMRDCKPGLPSFPVGLISEAKAN